MPLRAHALLHDPPEGLAAIAPWLESHGATVTTTRFFADPTLPDPGAVDLVIAMGGPMSVNDEAQLPWLRAEKQFLRDAIGRGTAVLGICLGAQLIASALGQRVYPNAVPEIGWFPVTALPVPPTAFAFPTSCDVVHWHGETFDLPPGAVHLARSAFCAHQAFQVGRNVMGLQFHLEMTPEAIDRMIAAFGEELVPAPTIQSAAQLRAAPATAYARTNALLGQILEYLTRPSASPGAG